MFNIVLIQFAALLRANLLKYDFDWLSVAAEFSVLKIDTTPDL